MTVTHDSVAPSGTQPLRKLEDLVQDLATLTGLSSTQLDDQINHLEFPSFQFQGLTLVSPTMTDTLIDRWAESLKTQLHQPSVQNSASPTVTDTPVTDTSVTDTPVTDTPAKTKSPRTSQKRSIAPRKAESVEVSPREEESQPILEISELNGELPSIELKVPRDVFNLVSTRYDVAMKKVLPKDESSRKAYLQHIVNESDQGQEFLMQIAVVLAKKYKGRVGKDTAYKRMLEKAQALIAAA